MNPTTINPQRFRTEPHEVEALQVTRETCARICRWIGSTHDPDTMDKCGAHSISVKTALGVVIARPSDWVILDPSGVFSVLTAIDFAVMYHAVVVATTTRPKESIAWADGTTELPEGVSLGLVDSGRALSQMALVTRSRLMPGMRVLLKLDHTSRGPATVTVSEGVVVRVDRVLFTATAPDFPDYVGVLESEPLIGADVLHYGARICFTTSNVVRLLPSHSASSVSPPRAV